MADSKEELLDVAPELERARFDAELALARLDAEKASKKTFSTIEERTAAVASLKETAKLKSDRMPDRRTPPKDDSDLAPGDTRLRRS